MVESLLAIGGIIVLVGNVGAVLHKIILPSVEEHKSIVELNKKMKNAESQLSRLDKMQTAMCVVGLRLLRHERDGNGLKEMQDTEEMLIELLRDKDGII